MVKVDLRIITLDVPPQDIITRDNVTVKVNAVVFYRVMDAQSAIVQVERVHLCHIPGPPRPRCGPFWASQNWMSCSRNEKNSTPVLQVDSGPADRRLGHQGDQRRGEDR